MPSSTRWVSWLLEKSADPVLAPRVLLGLATVSVAAGDLASARAYAEGARRTAREAEDGLVLGIATLWLGFVALLQGENDVARQDMLDGLDCCQRTGDRGTIAYAHFFLGLLARTEGDYPTARAHFEEELAYVREIGMWGEVAKSLGALARTAWRAGDSVEAWRRMDESLSISQEKDVWYDSVLAFSPWRRATKPSQSVAMPRTRPSSASRAVRRAASA